MGVEQKLGNMGVVTTTLEGMVNWSRTNAMWPMLFGHMALVRDQLTMSSSVVVTTPIFPSFCSTPIQALLFSKRTHNQ